jgi:hypothetical protein
MSHLINIFLEPGKVFAELKEKPTFLLPMALMIVLSAVMVLMYFNKVDGDWFSDHQLAMSGKEMSAMEIEQAKKMMPSAPIMGVFGAVFGSIVITLIMLVMAFYYWLAGRISSVPVSFKHGLSLVSWSGVPSLLGLVVAIVGVVMMEPQTGLESLALTRIDPLLVQLPFDHAWSSFAKNVDLLSLWSIFLSALGWHIWGKTSWAQAIAVAATPYVLIFGGMAAWAMMKS